jgi:putative methylase
MITKKQLAIILSRLKTFEKPELMLEQYPTDSEIASEILWTAFMKNEIQDKKIADLGSGTGILGIGALLLGAKEVYFVDVNTEAMGILKENLKNTKKEIELMGKSHFLIQDIENFDEKVDLVIQNPPFGTKNEHIDKKFLEKAFSISSKVYSFHKTSSKKFIEAISCDNGFKILQIWNFDFPIKSIFTFHKKRIQRVSVSCWNLEK